VDGVDLVQVMVEYRILKGQMTAGGISGVVAVVSSGGGAAGSWGPCELYIGR